ncbi:hypothetical protein IPM19_02885 [bacterium]|nr:MAG: hypothetical protein IPM19_02885 [bacterium]
MVKGFIFLTSTGFSSEPVIKRFKGSFLNYINYSVAIVTTAAEEKENNKYAQLAKEQFVEMGFSHIDFIDLETEPDRDFTQYAIIYVCGVILSNFLNLLENQTLRHQSKAC